METFKELEGVMDSFIGGAGIDDGTAKHSHMVLITAILITAIITAVIILSLVGIIYYALNRDSSSDDPSFVGNSSQGVLGRSKIAPQRMQERNTEDPLDAFHGNSMYNCPKKDITLADYRDMELDNYDMGFYGGVPKINEIPVLVPNTPQAPVLREDGYQHWGSSTNAMINLLNSR